MSLVVEILADLSIVGAIAYSAYSGSKRGLVLIGLEIVSFVAATALALWGYHWFGAGIKTLAHVAAALGNVAAFIMLWVLAEVLFAIIIRFIVLPHVPHHDPRSRPSRVSGAVLAGLKTAAIVSLGLTVFAGLPLAATTKQPITGSFVARHLLAAGGSLPDTLTAGLGHDLNDSFNFFTVTAEPESDERIELGFTTTNITVNETAEAAMLVLLNRERTSRGLNALTLNTKARTVARAYSTDMFARGYFSHINLEGRSPFDRMRAGGVRFGSAGENLALAPTLQQAHDGLMKSPGHRANILSTSYNTVGIGIVDGGPYGLMVTQDFTD